MAAQSSWAIGYLDSWTTYERYVGWSCVPNSDEIVGIHIYASGVYIGGGNAALTREFAVAQACNSSHSNHGFDISVNVPANFRDGTMREVVVYSIHSNGTSAPLTNVPMRIRFDALPGRARPQNLGDIVGRDLGYGWAPLDYFGHIGIWDGNNVIEAIGSADGADTLKITAWENFSNSSNSWPVKVPVVKDFAQEYCSSTTCPLGNSTTFWPWIAPGTRHVGPEREIAAKRAYVSYLIGASYTRLGSFTPTQQGTGRYAIETCNPFKKDQCRPPFIQTKPARGTYRCETFVMHSYAASAIGTGYSTPEQKIASWNPNRPPEWDRQMQWMMSPARLRTPRTMYDNFGTWNY